MQLNKMREELTNAFIHSLEEEQLPWARGWSVVRHQNAVNGNVYRGINAFWLAYQAVEKCYTDPRWCTYKQAEAKGWHVKKGEKGVPIEFWSMYDKQEKRKLTNKEVYELREKLSDEEFKERIKPVSNTYTVFNAEQIAGIPELKVTSQEYDKDMCIEIRDDVLKGLDVTLNEGGNKAFYRPSDDSITMPPIDSFWAEYNYLSTFLHEAGHSTGHKSRMNRDMSGIFGSEKYAKEELRAEIASAFTTQAIGLEGTMSKEHIDNHKAYIQSWIAEIKNEPNELFKAINDATKISDYLIEKCNLKRFIREFGTVEDKKTEMDFEELERNFLMDKNRDVSAFGWQVPMADREEMIIKVFKKKTKENYQAVDGMSIEKVEEAVRSYLQDVIASSDINVTISDVIITGSRARGFERDDSDLDIIVAYNGSFPEDGMFNLLHKDDVKIGNVRVDFNPISLDKRVSLADYLLESERYMYDRIKALPDLQEKVASYGLPNQSKVPDVNHQELRRTSHVRR